MTNEGKIFIRFLKNEGIYDAWKKNVISYSNKYGKYIIKNVNKVTFDSLTLIDNSFHWKYSVEGHEYWNEIYNKFMSELHIHYGKSEYDSKLKEIYKNYDK